MMQVSLQTLQLLQVFMEDPSQPRYGLELAKRTGLKSGTVYPALGRLEHEGWLTSAVEEVDPKAAGRPARRILVAGIGNVFLGDDGFGVALADRLARRALPAGVQVVDYGIRGMDLAYALHDGWDAVLLLDATPRGRPPGTLYVIEPDPAQARGAFDAHGMNPLVVLGLAAALGGPLPRILVVGCEPQTVMRGDEEDVVAAISEPVRAALDEGVALVESLLRDLTSHEQEGSS